MTVQRATDHADPILKSRENLSTRDFRRRHAGWSTRCGFSNSRQRQMVIVVGTVSRSNRFNDPCAIRLSSRGTYTIVVLSITRCILRLENDKERERERNLVGQTWRVSLYWSLIGKYSSINLFLLSLLIFLREERHKFTVDNNFRMWFVRNSFSRRIKSVEEQTRVCSQKRTQTEPRTLRYNKHHTTFRD